MLSKLSYTLFLFFFSLHYGISQEINLPLNRDLYNNYDNNLNKLNSAAHTSIKPYRISEVPPNLIDSINNSFYFKDSTKRSKKWFYRKLSNEHLISVKKEDFSFVIDPLFNFSIGRDFNPKHNYYTNTRGIAITGSIGRNFSYNSSFYETQAKFPVYLSKYINSNSIIPGQGAPKIENKNKYDYGFASGYISYSPSKYFNFQLGHDKHFIGDGYRSLLLSDNSFNYPFLKITTTFWKIKYLNLYTEMLDLRAARTYERGFRKKYSTFHYLSWNVYKRLNIGLFESIVWQGDDSSGHRGFDVNYLNPIIFFRPVEHSLGSPDNALLGLTIKFKINDNNLIYGQVLIDEFLLKHVKANNGWWANKYGFQIGGKSFNIAKINNLGFQTEFNWVRPFTYSHYEPLSNYAHYNQALAHPLGSNFYESVSLINYRYKRFFIAGKFIYAIHGIDPAGINFGGDIYKSSDRHEKEFNNYVGQGIKNELFFQELRLAYIINPAYNMIAEISFGHRDDNAALPNNSSFITLGIKTALNNQYLDF